MVKIRYSELPAGLHVAAEADGRGTIVYLLPGLTPAQRRAALVRVRSSARMGQGPKLPALDMAIAIAADRVRTTTRNGAAAIRTHPMLFLPPLIAFVSSAIVFMLMSFVTLTVAPHAKSPALLPTLRLGAGQSTSKRHHHGSGQPSDPGSVPGAASRSAQATLSVSPAPSGPRSTAPAPYPSGPSSSPTLSSAPSASPSPSPSPSQSSDGTCIKLGPLGLCVNI